MRQRSHGNGSYGGGQFSRGQLYKILANAACIGRIPHAKQSHAGLHSAIIDAGTWDATRARLADNLQGSRTRVRAASPSLLAGKLVDTDGRKLIASHASKAGRRYRYYSSKGEESGTAGMRVPALEIEAAVTSRLAAAFNEPFALAADADTDQHRRPCPARRGDRRGLAQAQPYRRPDAGSAAR